MKQNLVSRALREGLEFRYDGGGLALDPAGKRVASHQLGNFVNDIFHLRHVGRLAEDVDYYLLLKAAAPVAAAARSSASQGGKGRATKQNWIDCDLCQF